MISEQPAVCSSQGTTDPGAQQFEREGLFDTDDCGGLGQ